MVAVAKIGAHLLPVTVTFPALTALSSISSTEPIGTSAVLADRRSMQREEVVSRKTVHVVDDNASFRKAMTALLTRSGYEVLTYASGQHLLDQLPNDKGLGCLILDVRLPGMTGPELQAHLIELGLRLPIIFLTGYEDTQATVRTIKAGGEDFLIKPVESEQLLGAVERAIARHAASLEERHGLEELRTLLDTLTSRERQVFDLVVRGKMNKQIAFELGTTERTIKAHRHQVMEKMRVHSLPELIKMAGRLGLI
jgi:FixJ family two-component response regulator